MSATRTKCDLNKTWTILPEDEDVGGDGGGGDDGDDSLAGAATAVGTTFAVAKYDQNDDDDDGEDEDDDQASLSCASEIADENENGLLNFVNSFQNCKKQPTDLEVFNSQYENFESLFDENFGLIIEFENGDPIIVSHPTSPARTNRRRLTIAGSSATITKTTNSNDNSASKTRRRRSTRAQLNVTIDLEPSSVGGEDFGVQPPPQPPPTSMFPPSSTAIRGTSLAISSSSSSSLSSTSIGQFNYAETQTSTFVSNPLAMLAPPIPPLPPSTASIRPRQVLDDNDAPPASFDARSVPKSFDMFLSDIRKSSSTLDIHLASSQAGVAADASIMSNDDLPLNRTFKISPNNKPKTLQQPPITGGHSSHVNLLTASIDNELDKIVDQTRTLKSNGFLNQPNKVLNSATASSILEKKSSLPRLSPPSKTSEAITSNQAAAASYRTKLATMPQPTASSAAPLSTVNKYTTMATNLPQQQQQQSLASRMPRPSSVFVASSVTKASSTNVASSMPSSTALPKTSSAMSKAIPTTTTTRLPASSSTIKTSVGAKGSPISRQSNALNTTIDLNPNTRSNNGILTSSIPTISASSIPSTGRLSSASTSSSSSQSSTKENKAVEKPTTTTTTTAAFGAQNSKSSPANAKTSRLKPPSVVSKATGGIGNNSNVSNGLMTTSRIPSSRIPPPKSYIARPATSGIYGV